MSGLTDRRRGDGSVVLGGLLVAGGLIALALTWAGVDPATWLEGSGWTLFVIVPGVALLVAGLWVGRQAAGEGLTIAGATVTTIGLMLLVMDRMGAWEAWAYAWALIPAAAGIGVVLSAIRTGQRERLLKGFTLIAVGAVMFIVGAWWFGTLFSTGTPPIVVGDAWPVLVIGTGIVVIAAGLMRRDAHPAAAT